MLLCYAAMVDQAASWCPRAGQSGGPATSPAQGNQLIFYSYYQATKNPNYTASTSYICIFIKDSLSTLSPSILSSTKGTVKKIFAHGSLLSVCTMLPNRMQDIRAQ